MLRSAATPELGNKTHTFEVQFVQALKSFQNKLIGKGHKDRLSMYHISSVIGKPSLHRPGQSVKGKG